MKLGSQKPETLQILGCVTRDKTQKMVDLWGGYHIYIYIHILYLYPDSFCSLLRSLNNCTCSHFSKTYTSRAVGAIAAKTWKETAATLASYVQQVRHQRYSGEFAWIGSTRGECMWFVKADSVEGWHFQRDEFVECRNHCLKSSFPLQSLDRSPHLLDICLVSVSKQHYLHCRNSIMRSNWFGSFIRPTD